MNWWLDNIRPIIGRARMLIKRVFECLQLGRPLIEQAAYCGPIDVSDLYLLPQKGRTSEVLLSIVSLCGKEGTCSSVDRLVAAN